MTVHDAPRREVRHVKLVLKEILIVDYKMVSARLLVLAALVASASAFAPAPKPLARPVVQKAHPRAARTIVAEGPYWEGEAPPSKVLGNMAAIPSIVLGPMSGVALGVGLYCVASSQIFQPMAASNMNPFYIAGSLCVPVSWGLHVAAWIQKKNGM